MKPSISWIVGISIVLIATASFSAAQETGQPGATLAQAALQGNVDAIKQHIARGEDVNAGDAAGVPPLCYAAQQSRVEAVRLLLDAGANVNGASLDGKTSLIIAAQQGSSEVVALLLNKGADARAKDQMQNTALHFAVQWGRKDMVEALINSGADVNARDGAQQTPLALAQGRQQLEIAELLKQRGAIPTGLDAGLPGQATPQTGEGPAIETQVDVNAIRLQLKEFEGLEAALQKVDANSAGEQRAWVQQRTDNRTALLRAAEKQFGEELAFVKKMAAEQKAAKTIQCIYDLTTQRKQRVELITEALRQERRAAMQQGTDPTAMGTGTGRGRGVGRMSRTRVGTGGPGQAGVNASGNGGPEMAPNARRPEPNEPAVDPAVDSLVQAWVGATAQNKQGLLDAAYKLDLADLVALRTVATEEKARKTAAAISGLMLMRQLRVEKITNDSRDEAARLQKLQDRMGMNNTMTGGRGTRGAPGATPDQSGQTGTVRNRRYR